MRFVSEYAKGRRRLSVPVVMFRMDRGVSMTFLLTRFGGSFTSHRCGVCATKLRPRCILCKLRCMPRRYLDGMGAIGRFVC